GPARAVMMARTRKAGVARIRRMGFPAEAETTLPGPPQRQLRSYCRRLAGIYQAFSQHVFLGSRSRRWPERFWDRKALGVGRFGKGNAQPLPGVNDQMLSLLHVATSLFPAGADLVGVISASGQRRRSERAHGPRLSGLCPFEPDLGLSGD